MQKKPKAKPPQKAEKKKRSSETNPKYLRFALPIILLITALVFSGSISNGFAYWDDNKYILDNPFIRDFSWNGLKKIWSSIYFEMFIPVTTTTWWLQFHFWGAEAKVYHLIDLIFHLLNTSLVFYFIKLFSKRYEAAIVVAMFFAIHPMHVESVAWIAERKDLVYSFFFLLALLSYIKYILSKTDNKPIASLDWRFYFLTLVLFVLSLLSKPTALTLSPVLFLLDYYFGRKILSVRVIAEKIPFLALSFIAGISTIYTSGHAQLLPPHYSPVDRFFLMPYSLAFYVVKFFFPLGLSAFYSYPVFPGEESTLPTIYYFSPSVVILMCLLVWKSGKFRKDVVFGLLFFLATIVLFLQVVLAGGAITGDRYTYIPYIGLLFIVGRYVEDDFSSTSKSVLAILLGVYVLVFCAMSFNRTKIWKDGISVYTDMVEKNPTFSFGYNNRGLNKAEAKDFKGAIEDYSLAIQYNVKNGSAYYNRAAARLELGDLQGAMEDFKNGILFSTDSNKTMFNNRGRAKAALGDYQSAMDDFNTAISMDTGYADAYNNRGNLKSILHQEKEALEDYNTTIRLKPNFAAAIDNRAYIRYLLKDYEGSISDYSTVLKIEPQNAEAYLRRGNAKFDSGNKTEACEDWQRAAQLGGNHELQQMIERNCR